jgi:hypothetical protein
MKPEPVRLDEMGARLRRALALTSPELRSQVIGGRDNLIALAGRRADTLPEGTALAEPAPLGADERFALLSGFLDSREGARLRGDADAQEIVARAIDFCADHVDGRPLRWSPTVVGMFVAGWLPGEPGDLSRVPEALGAWVEYAGRRRGLPADRVEETVAAIDEWLDDMHAIAQDGGAISAE